MRSVSQVICKSCAVFETQVQSVHFSTKSKTSDMLILRFLLNIKTVSSEQCFAIVSKLVSRLVLKIIPPYFPSDCAVFVNTD